MRKWENDVGNAPPMLHHLQSPLINVLFLRQAVLLIGDFRDPLLARTHYGVLLCDITSAQ